MPKLCPNHAGRMLPERYNSHPLSQPENYDAKSRGQRYSPPPSTNRWGNKKTRLCKAFPTQNPRCLMSRPPTSPRKKSSSPRAT